MKSLTTYYHQWLTAAGAAVIMMEMGFYNGWSSPYLARLTAANSTLPLTPSQASWVASLHDPGRFVGSIVGAILASFYGSKHTTTLSIIPMAGCWICTICATNPIWLYVARFSGGLGIGITSSCMSLFGAEVASPEIRGAIGSAVTVGGFSIGIVTSSISGPYMSMGLSATIFLIPCILVTIFFLWLPETPLWLVKTNNDKAAKRSIAWYRPMNDPEIELSVLKKFACTSNFQEKIKKCIKSGPLRRAIFIMIVLFTLVNLTGICSIGFYMETILIRSKLTIIKPSNLVIYVHVTCIFVSILATCLIDRCGRKFLISVSSIGMAISQFSLGINSYLVKENADVSNLQWLPIASLFTYIDSYFIGLMSVPSTILGEIFPSDVNYLVMFIACLTGSASSFVVTKSFQPMIDLIGESYVFWIQATFAFLIVPFACLFLPETKGKSLQQIQEEMMQ